MNYVWAPFAKKVEIHVGQRQTPMTPEGDGWWRLRSDFPKPGDDYYFSLDGGKPLPDPRSKFQPQGVNGPSRVLDHTAFNWTDRHWQARPLGGAVLYELHIGTFTPEGTYRAAMDRLEHLSSLGITHIELMPLSEFLGDYGWGYDGVFPFAPHHTYGTPDDLKKFIDACHAHGLGVLLDVVYNHMGPSGNCLPQFGPYFTGRHKTPWGDALNFDGPHSDEVRRFFCDSALSWLRDYHFDGLRLDAVHAIIDTSAVPFLEQLSTEVDALKSGLGRHLFLIAESDLNDPRIVRPWEVGGYGLDAQWSDDIHHALHTVLTGEREGYYADFGSLKDLGISMTRPYVYAGRHSEFRKRRHGRPAVGVSGSSFVAYLQNHDQLGNRAQGDRIDHLINLKRSKIGTALIVLSPYVPMLFQGEEWAARTPFQYFVDFKSEPDLEKAVAKGRMSEFASFGWSPEKVPDPTDVETFQRSKLDWSELDSPEHREMLEWYRKLIALRFKVSAFTDGRLDLVEAKSSEEEQWLIVYRDCVVIACNFSEAERSVEIRTGAYHLLAASEPNIHFDCASVTLPPESVAILSSESGSSACS